MMSDRDGEHKTARAPASVTPREPPPMAQPGRKAPAVPAHHDCDFRDMLSRVGDKWSLLVIAMLERMPGRRGRFSDLKRAIPGISQRMLTATLRNLERDGMLTRYVFPVVPP